MPKKRKAAKKKVTPRSSRARTPRQNKGDDVDVELLSLLTTFLPSDKAQDIAAIATLPTFASSPLQPLITRWAGDSESTSKSLTSAWRATRRVYEEQQTGSTSDHDAPPVKKPKVDHKADSSEEEEEEGVFKKIKENEVESRSPLDQGVQHQVSQRELSKLALPLGEARGRVLRGVWSALDIKKKKKKSLLSSQL